MITVLSTSDEVEQLVLRNTDLTDQLLLIVADALKSSSSEVALLNLNLNLIGPDGARILLDVLKVKPQVKSLHLFGNRLCDDGALALLSGIAELQEQTSRAAAAANLSTGENFFSLVELDIGGNNLSGVGLKVLASYMRQHSHLQYLGLAQTGGPDLAAWKELFDSLKGNDWLTHIILDENNLGDPGVRLLADVLKSNPRLQMVDLDGNHVTDVGGNHLVEALLCRGHVPMRHLSLAENNISSGLMRRIREEVKGKSDRFRDEQCEK
ncbi:NLR family CARD domain-containing protein 3 isoform X3 [Syngnathus typhle]|nr:NLR family CARD domain-containing protein 3 isoform X3 [Syngnathus typhle]